MTRRPVPVCLEAADIALLALGRFTSAAKDARCRRLARLRLIESTSLFLDKGVDMVAWRTTDKGTLAAAQTRIVR